MMSPALRKWSDRKIKLRNLVQNQAVTYIIVNLIPVGKYQGKIKSVLYRFILYYGYHIVYRGTLGANKQQPPNVFDVINFPAVVGWAEVYCTSLGEPKEKFNLEHFFYFM